eukprot:5435206-Alexandrium_andersonii.AAC.1
MKVSFPACLPTSLPACLSACLPACHSACLLPSARARARAGRACVKARMCACAHALAQKGVCVRAAGQAGGR